MVKKVLILCTGNSCRSQMAEVIWNHLGAGQWLAQSAGSKPSGHVHPLALTAISELGLGVEGLQSKNIDAIRIEEIDLLVTVCDNAKNDCPVSPTDIDSLHWPFDDPAEATGGDNEKMLVFRRVRDEIFDKIKNFLKSSQ